MCAERVRNALLARVNRRAVSLIPRMQRPMQPTKAYGTKSSALSTGVVHPTTFQTPAAKAAFDMSLPSK